MEKFCRHFNIVIAEDDEDDYLLIAEALKGDDSIGLIHWAKDGEELLNYLEACDKLDSGSGKKPNLIILDLNMPKKDGREVLNEIKTHPKYKSIPIVILTTSQADADISQAYQLGANSFIQKPFKYTDFKSTMEALQKYWLNIVKLPA
ncbi:MAG: response regulator [Nitrospina sp.]|jgi:two-component system, response regulator|nr:response regulator [Nitrospina sp.]MBT3414858.1 response regulator [Nitrospina sp.]MBT4104417.1 response regulator [Nitrospina sp.]MBT4375652.1 response regulator [Nitrospina sp.]MBT4619796.1 response regulator [Nitrospina sp.]